MMKAVGMLGSQAAYIFTTADGGYITISEEALRTAGVLDVRHVASRHPTVTIKQVTGQEAKATTITLDIGSFKSYACSVFEVCRIRCRKFIRAFTFQIRHRRV